MKLLLFALVAGASVQAWRNFPADGPLTATSAMLLGAAGMVLAYCVGRGRRFPGAVAVASASASAEATAVASNQLQVNVAVVTSGEGARAAGVSVPSDDTAWIGAPARRPELDELDGMDLSELIEHDTEASEVDR